MSPRLLSLSCCLALTVSAAVACSDPPIPPACPEIPDGGCPAEGPGVCEDPTCAAVYGCNGGQWVLQQTCPAHPHHAAPPIESGADAGTLDARVDAPPGAYGGPGCVDLQVPDCSVGAAIACAGSADCCGCQDLFVCQNGGWTLWGECTDAGVVPAK